MEWVFYIVLAVMLVLLGYTVFWTSRALNKKGQPAVDSLFDALQAALSAKSRRPRNNDDSIKSH
jgi:hypothetical protein